MVDTDTLSRKVVEQPSGGAIDYISDGQGNVRIMGLSHRTNTGYSGNKINYSTASRTAATGNRLTVNEVIGEHQHGLHAGRGRSRQECRIRF